MNRGSKPVLLTGMPGSGKTSAGRVLARLLAVPFCDLDEEFERCHGLSAAQAIDEKGEAWFRAREAELLDEQLGGGARVVACGGGTLARKPQIERALKKAVVVYLEASPETICGRLGDASKHPLLRGGSLLSQVTALLSSRKPFYEKSHVTVKANRGSPVAIALAIRAELRERGLKGYRLMHEYPAFDERENGVEAWLELGTRSYPVRVSRGPSFGGLRAFLDELSWDGNRIVVVDEAVAALYGESLAGELSADAGQWIVVRGGEEAKDLGRLEGYINALLKAGADRKSVVIAVGGGTILDAAGFAASVFMRGIPAVHVPTTFLAAVDAGVGGKTAMNVELAKNIVGTFAQPMGVFVPLDVVWGEIRDRGGVDGNAELVKTCLLAGVSEDETCSFVGRGGRIRKTMIEQAVTFSLRHKMHVVSGDEREESGGRTLLNLGHTLAHLVESSADFEIPHGRAVGWGLVTMARLSVKLSLAEPGFDAMVERICRRFGLWPPPAVELDSRRLAQPLHDKKAAGGLVTLVLMRGLGAPALVRLDETVARNLLVETATDIISVGSEGEP